MLELLHRGRSSGDMSIWLVEREILLLVEKSGSNRGFLIRNYGFCWGCQYGLELCSGVLLTAFSIKMPYLFICWNKDLGGGFHLCVDVVFRCGVVGVVYLTW